MHRLRTLKKRQEFLELTKEGTHIVTKGIILQAIAIHKTDENTNNEIEIGFTVSKRIGNAVTRNRVKRRLREVAKEVMHSLAKRNFKYVLVGRKSAINRQYKALIKDLRYALHKIHQ